MKLLAITSSFLVLFNSFSVAQDNSESAAEASVTGSASQPALNAPDTSDSNPIVSIVRLGVPINSALKIPIGSIIKLASASGGLSEFKKAIESVGDGADIDAITTALDSGLAIDDAINAVVSGLTADQLGSLAAYNSLYDLTSNSDLIASINAVILAKADSYSVDNLQIALTEAVKVADVLLTDQVITQTLPTPISAESFTSGSGYNYELARLLVEYGAIGDKGSSLASALLGTEFAASTGTGTLTVASSTSDYINYLATLTGSATFGEVDAASSVLDVPMSNVSLSAGSNITLGSEGEESEISVSTVLYHPPTVLTLKEKCSLLVPPKI